MVGARALARGRIAPQGLITATPLFAGVPLVDFPRMVFGGHEVRRGTLGGSAEEIARENGTIPATLLAGLRADLARADAEVRRGTLVNAGRAIDRLAGARAGRRVRLRAEARRLQGHLRAFLRRHRLEHCVCVNLASTEPQLELTPRHRSAAGIEQILDQDRVREVRPSLLYAYAAASLGQSFVHFTPSNAALVPGIQELFALRGAPFMGRDGKTGETLVKSSLAPLFKYRNLRVLAWQGYNMLGDRDGAILAEAENKRTKVATKDSLLARILGYAPHSHVGIDYVPSLGDLKTAWDFIHFEGFLGHRMAMEFTWHGCDAILAAPLVLDMVRLADLARRRGEAGAMPHLACFFKQPEGVPEQDLHAQWHMLVEYARAARA
ncbi:MAG: inositol-3-phosphate synthase [Planctomycetes bacterium]|nr:inositol-3-phosphate synthase [Planctomycetota bacterium]